jgi:hypothetical protein
LQALAIGVRAMAAFNDLPHPLPTAESKGGVLMIFCIGVGNGDIFAKKSSK